ncbi:MAG TPA: hypothetical protein PK006_12515 [Saprospiraceae bacterium]|nr:hypothetical protein [Saprospiraceae bacterium]
MENLIWFKFCSRTCFALIFSLCCTCFLLNAQSQSNPYKICKVDNTIKTKVYVNIHFILTEDGKCNYTAFDNGLGNTNITGLTVAQEVIDAMNSKTNQMEPMKTKKPDGTDHPHIKSSGTEYVLYSEPSNSNDLYHGVWFHNYDKYDTTISISDGDPNFSYEELLALNPTGYGDKVYHIFLIGVRWYIKDGIRNYSIGGTSFLQGGQRVHNGWYEQELLGSPVYGLGGILNHEFGHLTGLSHTVWVYTDPLTGQTYKNTVALASDIDKDAEVVESNNVMTYGGSQAALSAEQFRIWRDFLLKNTTYKFIDNTNLCIKKPNPIIIPMGSNVVWDSYLELDRQVIVEPTATLRITCDIRTNSRITVMRGGKLIVQASISNLCPTEFWPGIEVWGNPNKPHPPLEEIENRLLTFDDPGVVILKAATLSKPVDGVFT